MCLSMLILLVAAQRWYRRRGAIGCGTNEDILCNLETNHGDASGEWKHSLVYAKHHSSTITLWTENVPGVNWKTKHQHMMFTAVDKFDLRHGRDVSQLSISSSETHENVQQGLTVGWVFTSLLVSLKKLFVVPTAPVLKMPHFVVWP